MGTLVGTLKGHLKGTLKGTFWGLLERSTGVGSGIRKICPDTDNTTARGSGGLGFRHV